MIINLFLLPLCVQGSINSSLLNYFKNRDLDFRMNHEWFVSGMLVWCFFALGHQPPGYSSNDSFPAENDCAILYEFATATTNAAEVLGWNTSGSHWCCDLVPVICDESKLTVNVIDFSGLSITGTISSSFGALSNLTSLDLGNNNFEGEISALGSLSQLTQLSLDNNNFEGEISALN